MKQISILFFLLLLGSPTTFAQKENLPSSSKTVSILFIGNSLTYTNNLPKLVEQTAKQYGISITTAMVAFPNYALQDHWHDGTIQKHVS